MPDLAGYFSVFSWQLGNRIQASALIALRAAAVLVPEFPMARVSPAHESERKVVVGRYPIANS